MSTKKSTHYIQITLYTYLLTTYVNCDCKVEKHYRWTIMIDDSGLSSLEVPGVPWYPQILADQLTLSQPRGADYAHQIILAPQIFRPSDGPVIVWWLSKKNEYQSRNTLCSADINNVCKQARQNIYRFASLICYVKKYITLSHCFEVGISISWNGYLVKEREKIYLIREHSHNHDVRWFY